MEIGEVVVVGFYIKEFFFFEELEVCMVFWEWEELGVE